MLQRVRDNPGRAVIACSIRDILQRRRDDREMETVRRVRESFDAVLVHGDPGIIALDESFGRAAKIRDKLVYTGYVASAPVPRTLFTDEIAGDIVVAAGGGAAGAQLYQVALDAANRDDLGRRWRLLVGAAVDEGAFRRMQREAGPATRVERNRADFRELLARSRILVSQAGYNTLTDILVTGVPALLVPFESVGETEQLARARRFERLGRVDVLRECDLDPEALLERLSEAMTKPEPGLPEIDLGGIGYTADWIIDHALTC
ncbi:MAG: hypothetical protein DWQ08_12810 [Proteobacteria bacterium]|nr:MAG: hypothetical protein DWQ08_12810 [Pseudomonadota bacterium]